MVKQNSSTHFDGNMNEYRMRTSHAGKVYSSRSNPPKSNRVQITQSNGCCSPKKPPSHPVHTQPSQTPRPTAHERSHSRLDPPDPFYHHHGRIKKNSHRTGRTYQLQHGRNQVHSTQRPADQRQTNTNHQSHYSPSATKTSKKNSCCTIL